MDDHVSLRLSVIVSHVANFLSHSQPSHAQLSRLKP